MTDASLKELSHKEKKVAAKALRQTKGYSYRQIQKLLGISANTALRAQEEQTPEELAQFDTDFKRAIDNIKVKSLARAQKRILELLPGYKRLDHVIKAAEYLEGKNAGQVNIQQNFMIHANGQVDKYTKQDV